MPGTLVISLDFELHWGVQDTRSLSSYEANLRNVRQAIRELLKAFDKFEIHATWATVGLLGCHDPHDARAQSPAQLPTYDAQELNPYRILNEPGVAEQYYFAPEVIETIASQSGQEIGTHTFSHFYCLEPGQTKEQFRADLRASLDVLSRYAPRPRSIVFPRNQYASEYVDICREEGVLFIRGNPASTFYDPHSQKAQTPFRRLGRLVDSHLKVVPFERIASRMEHRDGMIDVSASRFLRPTSQHNLATRLRIERIIQEMQAAAQLGKTYHLWWHPHNTAGNISSNIQVLNTILKAFHRLRNSHDMRSLNMAECGEEYLSRQVA